MISVQFISPTGTIYNGNANYISVPTPNGNMGILKDHIPNLSLLNAGKLTIKDTNNKTLEWELSDSDGFFMIRDNKASILASSKIRRI
jgi:F-type H+-transporting ATPase subunit epsilon